MAGTDQYGQPTWADSDPVNLAVDLTIAAAHRLTGMIRAGTRAEREAQRNIPEGCRWVDTDGTTEWVYRGGQWLEWRLSALLVDNNSASTVNGWHNPLAARQWSVDDPLGLIAVEGGAVKILQPGLYRLWFLSRLTYTTGVTTYAALVQGTGTLGDPSSAKAYVKGETYNRTSEAQLSYVTACSAGELWAPWVYTSAANQTRPGDFRLLIEKL
ncbi:hypothetical protein PV375_01215 [Gulosibacter sp. GYB002]|uniref:hypothetical protein n=1 Tax=Gulosibacter sp. GYB002 TaxID=2994391 RepID=UPI002F966A86